MTNTCGMKGCINGAVTHYRELGVNTNRDFIGIELEQGYFEIAKKRILGGEV